MSNDESDLSSEEKSQTTQDPPPTWVEWSARGVSLLIVLSLFAYLIFAGLSSSEPATLIGEVLSERIDQRDGAWVVPATITNDGDVSVSEVKATLQMVDASGEVVESEQVDIPLLGQAASASVQFWFSQDPAEHRLEFDFGSYQVP